MGREVLCALCAEGAAPRDGPVLDVQPAARSAMIINGKRAGRMAPLRIDHLRSIRLVFARQILIAFSPLASSKSS